jgi:Uma2 family endonuclease
VAWSPDSTRLASGSGDEAYSPIPPDLVVEVLSPSNDPGDMRIKITNYLTAGTTMWVVDPYKKLVGIFAPGQKAQKHGLDDTLDGGEVLPGFTLAVKDIFPAEE